MSGLKKFDQAEERYKQALQILEIHLAKTIRISPSALTGLVRVYLERDKPAYGEIEANLKRALNIQERTFGPEHIAIANTLDTLRSFASQNKIEPHEAESIEARAKAIRAKVPQPAPEK
jgi:hypothetical protein